MPIVRIRRRRRDAAARLPIDDRRTRSAFGLGHRLRYSAAPMTPLSRDRRDLKRHIMPELPEVETTRRGVAPHVVGRHVAELHVYDRRLRWPVPPDLRRRLRGRTIEALERRSKYLLFRIGANTLLMHFGMTGTLRVYRSPPPRRLHDHVDLVLDDGTTLRYHDPRRFGALLWVRGSGATHPLLRDLGPEPFDPAFDARYLWSATRGRRAAIKVALMDNRLVVGVGNIYANEALFRAGIRPSLPAGRLSIARAARLVAEVRNVLT